MCVSVRSRFTLPSLTTYYYYLGLTWVNPWALAKLARDTHMWSVYSYLMRLDLAFCTL